MPYDVVQNEVKEAKAGAEIASEALTLGYVRNVIQPTVDKASNTSNEGVEKKNQQRRVGRRR